MKNKYLDVAVASFDVLIHPCQFQIGKLVIRHKTKILLGLDKAKMSQYLNEKIIPFVLGPDKKYWITDRHHTSLALINIRELRDMSSYNVKFKQIEDYSNESWDSFYKMMIDKKYFYLKENGVSKNAFELPKKLSEMSDDPYRSISWLLREAGVYDKVTTFYLEFIWADFIRIKLTNLDGMITKKIVKKAIKKMMKYQDEIKNYPGYKKYEFKTKKEKRKKIKKMLATIIDFL